MVALHQSKYFALLSHKELPEGNCVPTTADIAYTANDAFSELEEKLSKRFDSKELKIFKSNTNLKFNDGLLHYGGKHYTVT